jgi:hypothetical protein
MNNGTPSRSSILYGGAVPGSFTVSHDSIIRLFRGEPGVLLLHPPRRRGVRGKITMPIPESVVERIYRRFGGG